MEAPRRPVSELAAIALLMLSAMCWAGNHVTGRFIAVEAPPVPPGGLSVLRWLLATLILLPFAWRHLLDDWGRLRARPGVVIFLGLLGGAAFSCIQFYGLRYTTAINVGVMNSVAPAFIILAGTLIFRDVVRAAQLGGIMVSLIGVLVILTKGDPTQLGALSFNVGDLVVIGNMGIFAIYSAFLRLRPALHGLTFMTLMSAIACLGCVPVAVLETLTGDLLRPTWVTAGAVLYTALFTSVGGYLAWNAGVAVLGLQRAGPFLHLVPLFSALLSIALIGERPGVFHAVGLALIIAGVTIAARRPGLRA